MGASILGLIAGENDIGTIAEFWTERFSRPSSEEGRRRENCADVVTVQYVSGNLPSKVSRI